MLQVSFNALYIQFSRNTPSVHHTKTRTPACICSNNNKHKRGKLSKHQYPQSVFCPENSRLLYTLWSKMVFQKTVGDIYHKRYNGTRNQWGKWTKHLKIKWGLIVPASSWLTLLQTLWELAIPLLKPCICTTDLWKEPLDLGISSEITITIRYTAI